MTEKVKQNLTYVVGRIRRKMDRRWYQTTFTIESIRGAIIEFLVDDVEKDYERLAESIRHCLAQKPTIMPWGNKSVLFREPDGNLVNFFIPVTPEAIKKSGSKIGTPAGLHIAGHAALR